MLMVLLMLVIPNLLLSVILMLILLSLWIINVGISVGAIVAHYTVFLFVPLRLPVNIKKINYQQCKLISRYRKYF
jgi:hypothetical protein